MYALAIGKDATAVQWGRGGFHAENFQKWLEQNPGKVRFWVDAQDMRAEFIPDEA